MSHDSSLPLPHTSSDGGALEGITVLDCSQMLAGPICSMRLGDLGADIIQGRAARTRRVGKDALPAQCPEQRLFDFVPRTQQKQA